MKGTLRDMDRRRRMTGPFRKEGERIRWQAQTECLLAPSPYEHPHDGHLLVTSEQFFYLPDDKTVVPIPLADIVRSDVSKQSRFSTIVKLSMESDDEWTFDVYPQAGRAIRRRLRRWVRAS